MLIITKYLREIIIVILLIVIALMTTCEGETTTHIVPERKGEFEEQKPVYITKTDTVFKTKWKTSTDTVEIVSKHPSNDSLVQLYLMTKDSLKQAQMFIDAVSIRQFKNTFEDEYLELTISGEVQGYLNYIQPDYILKEREVQLPSYHRILAGAEIGNSTSLNDFRYKINLSLQNPKGDIYKVSYSKQFGEDYIWLGFEKSLFRF